MPVSISTFPDGKIVRLERILGLGHGCDGSSHLCSVADVLLGAFRYCVNDPENEEAAKAMFPNDHTHDVDQNTGWEALSHGGWACFASASHQRREAQGRV
jgi:hypothetical protein